MRISTGAIGERPRQSRWGGLLMTMRPHQWAKNSLLFLPAIAAQLFELAALLLVLTGFFLFSAVSSSVYLLNDVLDISHDRQHEKKKHRPIAAGSLPIAWAMVASLTLASAALTLAGLLFGWGFFLALLVYAVLANIYSRWLKSLPLVDIFALVSLYEIRLFAGAVLVSVPLSTWMVSFCLFAFLSLASLKRFVELNRGAVTGVTDLLPGRGYQPSDASLVSLFGVSAGVVGALILALYVDEAGTTGLYSQPLALWGLVPIWLLWVTRAWLVASRGRLNDDPVVYALKNRGSLILGALGIISFIWAVWES